MDLSSVVDVAERKRERVLGAHGAASLPGAGGGRETEQDDHYTRSTPSCAMWTSSSATLFVVASSVTPVYLIGHPCLNWKVAIVEPEMSSTSIIPSTRASSAPVLITVSRHLHSSRFSSTPRLRTMFAHL